ncbi:hypothetical protein KM043_001465 [Ampulex compressa]|nr:hypothetical protein KM043_001465 [Ampulex compressa]
MADVDDETKNDTSLSEEGTTCKTENTTTSCSKHVLKKRQPFGLQCKTDRDIYVTTKTNFKAQLNKCEKLFDSGASEVIIHGLGAAICRACNLALQLRDIHYESVELDVKTSTVSLIDDLEPLIDDADYETNVRCNSAIHIRVFRKVPVGPLKCNE